MRSIRGQRTAPGRCRSGRRSRSFQEALQRARATGVTQPRQRLLLDLPHPLARDPEERADLLERQRRLAAEPEVEAEDPRLAVPEGGERLADRLREGALVQLLVGRGALLV